MHKSKISITTVSIVFLVLLTSIVFSYLGYVFYNRQKEIRFSEAHVSIETTGVQLSKGLSVAMWDFDEEQIREILETALLDRNVDVAVLEYNDKGKTVLSLVKDGKGIIAYNKKILPSAENIVLSNDVNYFGEYVGKLTLIGTPRFAYNALKEEIWMIVLSILILIILMIVAVYYIFYFIVIKPIKHLEKYSLSQDFENKNVKMIPRRNFFKELDHLGTSLQKMIVSLKGSFKKLEGSEIRYREMSNLLPLSVFELNLNGKITFINEKGLSLFSKTREEIEGGIQFSSLISHKNLKTAIDNKNLLLDGKKAAAGTEYQVLKKDGTYFPMMMFSSVIYQDSTAIGIRAVGFDLTEQREREAAYNELIQMNFVKEKEREKLRTLSLIEGQERERLRISRDIHDGVGQMLTAIKLSSESINSGSINSTKDLQQLEYTKSLIHETIVELRQISSDLSPTFLYDYGVFSAVNQLVTNIGKISDIEVRLSSNIQKIRFLSQVEITIYRTVQEGINNALKYSKAKNLKINLIRDAEFLELMVEDDGVGFDYSDQARDGLTGGNGLRNMVSRANLINGYLSIVSSPGKGCQISLQIPIELAELEQPDQSKESTE